MFKKIIIVLLTLCLIGCSGENNNTDDILRGKTFYNTVERYGNVEHSYISFNNDSTFKMNEHYLDGYVELSGKYLIEDKQVKCEVTDCGLGSYEEINFEIEDDNTLILKTNLFNSEDNDLFTNEEIKSEIVNEGFKGYFINASQKNSDSLGYGNLELFADGTFILNEVDGLGLNTIKGNFHKEGDILMFSDFDNQLVDEQGNEIYNFEFYVIDGNTLELMKNLTSSKLGDCFSSDGLIPENYQSKFKTEEIAYRCFVHQLNDLNDQSLYPTLYLYDDLSFILVENCASGMGSYKGTYVGSVDGYTLTVADSSTMQGYTGADVKEILFELCYDGLILSTDLCSSRSGDLFIQIFEE